jgi:hypothetical protein
MKLRLVLLCVCTLLVSPNVARGQSDGREATLRGIRGVSVAVDLDERDPANDASRLQTLIELRLRQAGLSVGELKTPSVNAGIWVVVAAIKSPNNLPLYALHVRLQVIQAALLVREQIPSGAVTWEAIESIGVVGSGRIREETERAVQDQVDQFLNAYFAVNPKR